MHDLLIVHDGLARRLGLGGSIRLETGDLDAAQGKVELGDEERDDDAAPPWFPLESHKAKEPRAARATASKKTAPGAGKLSSSRGTKSDDALVDSTRQMGRRKNPAAVGMIDRDTEPVRPTTGALLHAPDDTESTRPVPCVIEVRPDASWATA